MSTFHRTWFHRGSFSRAKLNRGSMLVAVVFLFTAPQTQAQSDRDDQPHNFSLAAGLSWSSTGGFAIDVGGLRYGYDFNERWGMEFSLLANDIDDLSRSNRFLDVSATYVMWRNEDSRLLLFGGPGVLRYRNVRTFYDQRDEFGFPVTIDNGDDDTPTVHLGVAWEKQLTENGFLRTDLRFRRHVDIFDQFDSDSSDATVSFGWRF